MTQNISKTNEFAATIAAQNERIATLEQQIIELQQIVNNLIAAPKVAAKTKVDINLEDINIEDLKASNQRGKFSDDEIRKMRSMRAAGVTYNKVAQIFGVSTTFVRNVEQKNVYKHVID